MALKLPNSQPPATLAIMLSPPNAREAAIKVVRVLYDAGHTAYLAGGCVRDGLLGFDPKDYDVATDAKPETVRKLFRKTQFVGEAFGVVLVRVLGSAIEVATFRTEWDYQDGRRPTQVQFSDAKHDALRRDFTINALFENPLARLKKNLIIDYVGGRADLDAGLIRAVSNPEKRLGEDCLRMLRALRLATRLGFKLERRTAAAIRKHAPHLARISRERIGQEVRAMLTPSLTTNPIGAIRLLHRMQLDGVTLGEDHSSTKLTTAAAASRQVKGMATYATILAAWMLDRHVFCNPSAAIEAVNTFVPQPMVAVTGRWRRAICLSNDDRDELRSILKQLKQALVWFDLGVAARKRLLATECWPQVYVLLRAAGHRPTIRSIVRHIRRQANRLLAQGVAPRPWINGDDLIAMGHKPGPGFRRLLDTAYDAQLEGRLHNRQQALGWLRNVKQ